MQEIGDMEYWSLNGECNSCRSSQKSTKRKEDPHIGYCRIYGHSFFKSPFRTLGDTDLKEILFLE